MKEDLNNNGPRYETTKRLRSLATPQAAQIKICGYNYLIKMKYYLNQSLN